MKKILLNYILLKFFKIFITVTFVAYLFGIILNLFEEIEFFKNTDVNFLIPATLTAIYVPSLMIELLPFIIFVTSMWFLIEIKNKRELLTFKVHGYSNIKIFFTIAFFSFFLGWIILSFLSPIFSNMTQYYEKTKSRYARDTDHLINFNKNGLWIKENLKDEKKRIVYSKKIKDEFLEEVTIFIFDKNFNLKEKIIAKNADIQENIWELLDGKIIKLDDKTFEEKFDNYKISSIYNAEKINGLFKNIHTISFFDLVFNYNQLKDRGYNNEFLNQNLNKMLTLPFFLFFMTAIASILTMHTLKRSGNIKYIIVGIFVCVLVFYFKDLSKALGETNRISLSLSVWIPVIILGVFSFIGILQINEK